jgi:hypothetical protein
MQVSTFGSDNIEHLDNWLMLMTAKFASHSVDGTSCVVRRFIDGEKNKVEIKVKGKSISIPKKEIYHLYFNAEQVMLLNQKETWELQNTNCETGKLMEEEAGVTCMSSEELYENIILGKFDMDKILDKISKYGKENLSTGEVKFLESAASKNK